METVSGVVWKRRRRRGRVGWKPQDMKGGEREGQGGNEGVRENMRVRRSKKWSVERRRRTGMKEGVRWRRKEARDRESVGVRGCVTRLRVRG